MEDDETVFLQVVNNHIVRRSKDSSDKQDHSNHRSSAHDDQPLPATVTLVPFVNRSAQAPVKTADPCTERKQGPYVVPAAEPYLVKPKSRDTQQSVVLPPLVKPLFAGTDGADASRPPFPGIIPPPPPDPVFVSDMLPPSQTRKEITINVGNDWNFYFWDKKDGKNQLPPEAVKPCPPHTHGCGAPAEATTTSTTTDTTTTTTTTTETTATITATTTTTTTITMTTVTTTTMTVHVDHQVAIVYHDVGSATPIVVTLPPVPYSPLAPAAVTPTPS